MRLDVYKRCTSRQVIENIVRGQVTHSVHPELVQCVLCHRWFASASIYIYLYLYNHLFFYIYLSYVLISIQWHVSFLITFRYVGVSLRLCYWGVLLEVHIIQWMRTTFELSLSILDQTHLSKYWLYMWGPLFCSTYMLYRWKFLKNE